MPAPIKSARVPTSSLHRRLFPQQVGDPVALYSSEAVRAPSREYGASRSRLCQSLLCRGPALREQDITQEDAKNVIDTPVPLDLRSNFLMPVTYSPACLTSMLGCRLRSADDVERISLSSSGVPGICINKSKLVANFFAKSYDSDRISVVLPVPAEQGVRRATEGLLGPLSSSKIQSRAVQYWSRLGGMR